MSKISRRSAAGTALALLATLAAACSSTAPSGAPAPSGGLAPAVTACLNGALPGAPASSPGKGPGSVVWTAVLARCATGPQGAPSSAPADNFGAVTVPGGRLAVYLDGAVSMYSAATGARLWRRAATQADQAGELDTLDASGPVVLDEIRDASGRLRSTFLSAATGQVLGKADRPVPGDPFLVGPHVVLTAPDGRALEGYDPLSGKILWRTAVPAAPAADAEVNDGTVVYLDPEPHSSDWPAPQQSISRLDAATGRMLSPVTLPRRTGFDLAAPSFNSYAQGQLVLQASSQCGRPECPVTETVAVNPSTGTVRWARRGLVAAASGGLFAAPGRGAGALAAVDPVTGRTVWTIAKQGLDTVGGAGAVLLNSGSAVAWSPAPGGTKAVTGIAPPDGRQTWSSPRFTAATVAANTSARVYVASCTPWNAGDSAASICSRVTLTAVAV